MEEYDNNTFTYQPSEKWLLMTPEQRVAGVRAVLQSHLSKFDAEVRSAESNGNVVLKIEQTIPANERGLLLLNLESNLKKNVDEGITVWLEPVGDKSKLRQLRGVEIKG